MERLRDEVNLCEVKTVNLGEAWEKFQSEASGVVVLSLQWRDLEDHLKSVKGKVEERFVELQNRSLEIEERARVVEAWEVKADGFRREVEVKEEELSGLRMLVDEFTMKQRLKASELDEMVEALRKTQGETDSKGGVLAQMERQRVEVRAEMDMAETRNRELDEENERKTRDLTLVQDKVTECGKLLETRSLELTKTLCELDLKVEQLGQIKIDFGRHQNELTAEMDRAETRKRELDEEIKRKTRDLTLAQDKVAKCCKLLETRSLELTKTQCEIDLKVEQLGQVKIEFTAEMEHLERVQTRNRELEEDIERKRKDLAEVLNKTAECGKQLEARSLELVSKEKKLQELSLDLDLKEDIAISLDKEMESKAKELEGIEKLINERSGHYESTKLLIEELTEELASKEKRHDEMTEATRKLSVAIASKEDILTERYKQAEEGEKKILDLNNTNEELIRQVKMRQVQVSSINEAIRECTCELEAKRKHRDEIQSSITDLTVDLKSKESHLSCVEKKIQESLKDLQSTEEQQVKLKASLMEHEQGLELREKELIAREEKVNEQDQKVQLAKEELAKWVEAYEVKAKQLVALTPPDIDRPTGNSRKRGRYDELLSQSLDHVLTSCTTEHESTYNFENLRSPDKFKTDQIWAVYSDSDKGMPRKYAQIKKIDTNPEFNIHVALLVLYRPPPNLTTYPVCCGRFKLKIGKAEVLEPSSFSHKVNAVKSSVNRYEVYPGKGEVWALYKNWNTTDSAETGEEHEIVEIVETNEQSIQAMLLTAKVFNKLLYGRCLESKAGVVDIPKTEVNRFSHQIPAFRRDRRATRSGDCEWWELDSKAVLDLNSKKP